MSKTFEENLETLESLIKELENGDVSLDDAIKKYGEAMELVNKCDKELKETKEKIKIVSDNGELKNFE